ncbi:hypothetical protein BV511_15930 [Methylorubrum extorquens]|nr:hypothetical protein BV511_15930 [Methylorubrum extorquens]
MGHAHPAAFAARSTPLSPGYSRVGSGFVDEHETIWGEDELALELFNALLGLQPLDDVIPIIQAVRATPSLLFSTPKILRNAPFRWRRQLLPAEDGKVRES